MVRWMLFLLLLLAAFPAAAQTDCALPPRLQVGEAGRVLYTDGDPLNVRLGPRLDREKRGLLLEGLSFKVMDGPVCADGIHWWYYRRDGERGWIAEGADGVYFVEPLTNTQLQKSDDFVQQIQTIVADIRFVIQEAQTLRLTNATLQPEADLPAGQWQIMPGGVSVVRRSDSAGLFAAYLDGTRLDVTAPPPAEGRFFLDALPAPDRQQIAWLYEGCDSSQFNCDGRQIYTLVLTDADGSNPREIWREPYTSDATELFIGGWRDDSGAIFLDSTSAFACPEPGTPPGDEPLYCPGSSATMEVLTDGTAEQRIPVNLDGAISPDGAWAAYDTGERYRLQVKQNELRIEGRDGTTYSLPFASASRIYHLTFSPDSAYLVWIEVAYDADNRETGAELKAADLATGYTTTLRVLGNAAAQPVGWLANAWLMLNVGRHVLVADASTGVWAEYPGPKEGHIVGVFRRQG